MYLAVITKIPDPTRAKQDVDWWNQGGNLAHGPSLYFDEDPTDPDNDTVHSFFDWMTQDSVIDKLDEETRLILSSVQSPVFELGELLIMDESTDRTIPDGRKPDKWMVEYDKFPMRSFLTAIERSKQVFAEQE